MAREKKETPGEATPGEPNSMTAFYEVQKRLNKAQQSVDELAFIRRVGRVDACCRVLEAEAALNQSRLEADDIKLGRFQTSLQVINRTLRGLQLSQCRDQSKGNAWSCIRSFFHRFLN